MPVPLLSRRERHQKRQEDPEFIGHLLWTRHCAPSYILSHRTSGEGENLQGKVKVCQFSLIEDQILIPEKQYRKNQVHVGLQLTFTPFPPKHHQRSNQVFCQNVWIAFNIYDHSKCFPKSQMFTNTRRPVYNIGRSGRG